MMRIGQQSPSIPDKSTQVRETASPATPKTAPAAPPPSTPPPTSGGLPPAQSQFSTPTRPSTPAPGKAFVTPPPPAKGKSAAKLTPEHMKQAVSTAFEMVHNRPPDANELKTLLGKAQTMADEGKDFNGIKFGLHAELNAVKNGEPLPTPSSSSSSSSGSGGSAASDAIKQSIFSSAMGLPSSLGASMMGASTGKPSAPAQQTSAPAAKLTPEQMKQAVSTAFEMVHNRQPDANELKTLLGKARTMASEGKNFDGIKFGLHAELNAAKSGEPLAGAKVTPEHMKKAVGEAFEMVHNRPPDANELKSLLGKAQTMVSEGKDFDGIKFGLHAELNALKNGEPPPASSSSSSSGAGNTAATAAIKQSIFSGAMGQPSSLGASSALFGKAASVKVTSSAPAQAQAPLRQAVDDMHQLVFGMKASGASAQELMTHAQGLGATQGNDPGALRHALHSLLTGKSAPAGGTPAPLSKDRLTQAMNEAHQLVFGSQPSAAKALQWMGKAVELASQLKNDFHAVKFALHSQLSGKPMPAPGGAHPPPTDTQLRQALDEAHQVAFKQVSGGPHLNAWMDEARQLAAHHGNDLQAVKLALHAQMLEAK